METVLGLDQQDFAALNALYLISGVVVNGWTRMDRMGVETYSAF
jgi:hypothetical protein